MQNCKGLKPCNPDAPCFKENYTLAELQGSETMVRAMWFLLLNYTLAELQGSETIANSISLYFLELHPCRTARV